MILCLADEILTSEGHVFDQELAFRSLEVPFRIFKPHSFVLDVEKNISISSTFRVRMEPERSILESGKHAGMKRKKKQQQ